MKTLNECLKDLNERLGYLKEKGVTVELVIDQFDTIGPQPPMLQVWAKTSMPYDDSED